MKILILPGFSSRNKKWAEKLHAYLGENSFVHEWNHWQTENEKDFDFYKEADAVFQKIKDEEVYVIAHSVGTLITLFLISKHPDQFKKIILNGIPLHDFDQEAIDLAKEVLKNIPPEKIQIYQNSQDKHGTYEEVEQFVHNINPGITIIKKESNTHDYFYFEDFNQFLFR